MKRIIAVLTFLVLGTFQYCSAQALDGKWQGQMQGPDGAMTMFFNFKVVADSLTGTVESPMGALPISNGKINGEKFSFDVSFNEMTIRHQCTLMTDSISMKLPDMPGGEMEIFLKRAKASN